MKVDPRLRQLGMLAISPALLAAGFVLVLLGNAIGGLALLMAAWFARTAARARLRQDELARLIEGVTVGEVMETTPLVVLPRATLDTFAAALDGGDEPTVARVMAGDALLGLVGLREVERVPMARWPEVHAEAAMVATAGLPSLDPGGPLGSAADSLGVSTAPGLPVVSDGRLAGILTRLAVGRALHERAEQGAPRTDGS